MSNKANVVNWQGRSTKLTTELIDVMNELALDPTTAVLTDEELVLEINKHLKPANKISYASYRDWKNRNYVPKSVSEETLQAFSSAIKSIRIHQKKLHTRAMMEDEKAGTWQRRAWLLERKFDDLHLTQKIDQTVTKKEADIKIVPPSSLNIEEVEYEEIKVDK